VRDSINTASEKTDDASDKGKDKGEGLVDQIKDAIFGGSVGHETCRIAEYTETFRKT